ncbi:MAG TPA: ABC transporter ATP-binding protein [Pedobacter sp.]|jgi:ABC-2 type transport system ATP-binding protein
MIQISNLDFGYSRKNLLFRNLNLNLEAGHIYGLLGKNGAGKSTLLKNICGVVFPLSGSCKVKNVESRKRLPSFLQDLFFIPEDIYLPEVRIEKYLQTTSSFYPQFDKQQFYSLLEEFEVATDRSLNKLSFGQQKKVMIAFGLATNTSLLIMDEPTNGLDIPSKVQFRKIIASNLTEERCVLISTHQVRDLESLIDTLVVVHNREIMLNSSLDRIAEKLTFKIGPTEDDDVLFSESSAMGIHSISRNHSGRYSRVDMELLFSAIISNQQSVLTALKS